MQPQIPELTALLQGWLSEPRNLQQALAVAAGLAVLLLLVALLLRGRLARARDAHAAATERLGRAEGEATDLRGRLQAEGQAARDAALRAGQLEVRVEGQGERLAELAEERDGLTDALHQARQEMARLDTALAETRLAAAKDREAASRDIETLRGLREEMSGQFRLMANETLRVQGADMQRSHSEQLSALLNPFREQVHHFQRELRDRNKVLDEEGARLREHIEGLYRRSEEISREAVNLTRALKGEKQRQGAWGEMILERLLEESGLERGTHYDMQKGYAAEDGKQWRPDVIVRMPRQKILVIDSKVSLIDYEISVNAEDPTERDAALRRHVEAIRRHVATLAGKGYHAVDESSVDYVLMFIPIEGAFSEALRADPGLAGFAMDRRVGLATPTTLMLTLRTVDHIWTVERRESNAMEIAARAGQLYDKVHGFLSAMDEVGQSLDKAARAHGVAMDRLTRGPGNVVRQVEMLRELGARTQKRIGHDHDRHEALPEPD